MPARTSLALLLGLVLAAPTALVGCASGPEDSGGSTALAPGDLRSRLDVADADFQAQVLDEALEAYRDVHRTARRRGDAAVVTEAAAQIAATLELLGQADGSDEWMERAESGADETAPRAWTRVLLARGIRAQSRGQGALARGNFVSLYNYCFNHDLAARAVQAAGLVASASLGQERLSWSMRGIQAADTLRSPRLECGLWLTHAGYLDQADRTDEALDAYARARQVAATSDLPRLERWRAEWAYGRGLRRVGRFDEAREVLSEANAVGQTIYVKRPSARAAEFLGLVIGELGNLDADVGNTSGARMRYEAAIQKLGKASGRPGNSARISAIRA
ncbi:MAG: hypothetical protein AAFZ87_15355, partial [Planctomycetota bacterium]